MDPQSPGWRETRRFKGGLIDFLVDFKQAELSKLRARNKGGSEVSKGHHRLRPVLFVPSARMLTRHVVSVFLCRQNRNTQTYDNTYVPSNDSTV